MPPIDKPTKKDEKIMKLPTREGEPQRYRVVTVFALPDKEEALPEVTIEGIDATVALLEGQITEWKALRTRLLALP